MNATPQGAVRHSEDSEEFVFRIPKKPVAITALFFFLPDLKGASISFIEC